jgi:hypothetical protein
MYVGIYILYRRDETARVFHEKVRERGREGGRERERQREGGRERDRERERETETEREILVFTDFGIVSINYYFS